MKFLNMDNPVIQALDKLFDLMILNLLMVLCCLPIVTVGASVTAMHYVCLKMVRNEETYIFKMFFHSFKENFVQSTILWVMMLVLVGAPLYVMVMERLSGVEINTVVFLLPTAALILIMLALLMVFPLQAKFGNTILGTIVNSIKVGAAQFPRTVAILVLTVFPLVLPIYIPAVWPIVLLIGLTAPGYVAALMYNKLFEKIEGQYEQEHPEETIQNEDEHIFSDEQILK